MKTNHQSAVQPQLNERVSLNPWLRAIDPEPVNHLGRMGYHRWERGIRRLPDTAPDDLRIETPEPTPSGTPACDTAPSVLTLYLQEIGQVKLLSAEEEAALARRIRGGNEAAREQMIKANLRLVVSIAHNFDGLGVALLDLISEGNIGLMRAVDRFEPSRGVRFSTYASFWIRHHMRLALSHHGRTIRVPQHVYDKFHTIRSAAGRLEGLLGREPTNDEIAQETGQSVWRVQRMREAVQATVSLDAPISSSEEGSIAELVPGQNTAMADEAFAEPVTLQRLGDFLAQLSPRERAILRSRFGLGRGEARTLEQIGRRFGISRERVRQIQDGALQKLRKKFNAQELLRLAARCTPCRWSTT